MIENFVLRRDANIVRRETFPTGKRYYIPEGSMLGGKDGIIVTFGVDTNHEWTGVFAFGLNGNLATRAIVPFSKSDCVLIVSDGDGFIVQESVPGGFMKVRAVPIQGIYLVEPLGLVILADYTSLIAYRRGKIAWETDRIAWDDLQIDNVSPEKIMCTAFDIRSDEKLEFTVDTQTGICHGGIEAS